MGSYPDEFPFGIMEVVNLLNLRIRRQQANSVYVDCPFCGDRRGKMNVNFQKNVWRCNYCGKYGGMLALYAEFNHTTTSDAYWEIAEALCDNIQEEHARSGNGAHQQPASTGSPPLGTRTAAAAHSFSEREMVPQSDKASPAEIHQTLSLLLSQLSLRPAHREHLRSPKRGLSNEQIDALGFKSTPPPFLCRSITDRLIKQGCKVQGVPGFYRDDNGHWTMAFYKKTAGILIPAIGFDGRIQGFQIMLDVPLKNKDDPPEKTGAKYIWFSSSSKRDGAGSGSPVHLVGDSSARVVYVIEGLLKADISHCLTGRTFVAIAGANNTGPLDALFAILAQNGTEEIIEAHDMDKYNNNMTMAGASKIYLTARKHGMNCRRLTWNPNYKGFDDWQLALRRENQRQREIEKLSFKEQYLCGLCELAHIEDCTEQWQHRAEQDVSLTEYLGLTQEEHEIFLRRGRNALAGLLEPQRRKQRFVLYQLQLDEQKAIPFAFKDIAALADAGYEQPPAALYYVAGNGEIYCPVGQADDALLKRLFADCREHLPEGCRGRPMTLSDVVELYHGARRDYYYVNGQEQFKRIKFSPMLAKKA